MSIASKRIRKEITDMRHSLHQEIPENISAGPISDDNIFEWNATIIGAVGTPYAGGLFKLSINFPSSYPFVPPIVKFKTRIFHPNIHENGDICLDILKYHWSPTYSVVHILLSILSLLSDPNADDPLNPDAAHLYKADVASYNKRVMDYVHDFAN